MTTQTTEPQTDQTATADKTQDVQQVDIAEADAQEHKERVFKYVDPSGKEHTWADPGEAYTNQEVKRYLAKEYFSALRRADMEVEDLDDGRQLVKFVKRAGTKGADSPPCGGTDIERVFVVHYIEEYRYDDPGPEYDNRAVFDCLQQWFVNLSWGQTEIVVGDGIQEVHFHTAPGTKFIGTSEEAAEFGIDIANMPK